MAEHCMHMVIWSEVYYRRYAAAACHGKRGPSTDSQSEGPAPAAAVAPHRAVQPRLISSKFPRSAMFDLCCSDEAAAAADEEELEPRWDDGVAATIGTRPQVCPAPLFSAGPC